MTDIFLPGWLASNIANIYGPLFALGVCLHGRNILRLRRAGSTQRRRISCGSGSGETLTP